MLFMFTCIFLGFSITEFFSILRILLLGSKGKGGYLLDTEVRFLSPNFRFLHCRCLQPSLPVESGDISGHLEASVHLTFHRHLIRAEMNSTLASLAVKIMCCT